MSEECETNRQAEPESGGRLLLGWILIVAGGFMVFAGWLGVSASPQVAVQLTYLASGGVGGLLAGIVGIGLLVSDDIRKDRARLGRLEAAVLEMREFSAAQAEALGLAGAAPGDGEQDDETIRPAAAQRLRSARRR